ncbi:hypothetical protein EVAR_38849_1 [Eumeta japonica]|uniref:Uncharacterized protein n=1 Tax=Eumeta variegata TaxID=151549 RepID=A0A4C1X6E2_EUMVA|nr:hypothetical protein EVAR_38849_1 [Eumeta japonica]
MSRKAISSNGAERRYGGLRFYVYNTPLRLLGREATIGLLTNRYLTTPAAPAGAGYYDYTLTTTRLGCFTCRLSAAAVSLLLGRIGRWSGREIARSALSLARSAQAERDNVLRFFHVSYSTSNSLYAYKHCGRHDEDAVLIVRVSSARLTSTDSVGARTMGAPASAPVRGSSLRLDHVYSQSRL